MTFEPNRIRFERGGLGAIAFAPEMEPLPLVDPTAAAEFLTIKRHTLACYRNLGEGPPFYKFGRWIRYARADLRQWRGIDASAESAWALPTLESVERLLVDTGGAARFLTLTSCCLANFRLEGKGPRFCRFGRRIYYPIDELDRWARQQRKP